MEWNKPLYIPVPEVQKYSNIVTDIHITAFRYAFT